MGELSVDVDVRVEGLSSNPRTYSKNRTSEGAKCVTSWTNSFENVDSFEHEIFAAARTKIVTLTFAD